MSNLFIYLTGCVLEGIYGKVNVLSPLECDSYKLTEKGVTLTTKPVRFFGIPPTRHEACGSPRQARGRASRSAPQAGCYAVLRFAVVGAPAYRGRQLGVGSVVLSGSSGNLISDCISILFRASSSITSLKSIRKRSASAIAAYFRASASSIFACLVCWADWSKKASSIFCSDVFGLCSRYSGLGRDRFTVGASGLVAAGRTLLPRYRSAPVGL